MSVLRQINWLGQWRVDVPHLRSLESSICADFDTLAGKVLTSVPVVISGFTMSTAGVIGQPATSLQLVTAGGVALHPTATDSGTIYSVPTTRATEVLNKSNANVSGGFTASATNYIGIDLVRSADATTTDLVQFLNPLTNSETSTDVPLGRTLNYVIYISTQDFSTTPNVCPLAIVVTDASLNVVSVTDARNFFFRLGSGGSSPSATSTYSWPGGRTEVGDNSDFTAGDKAITSLETWSSAIMTRLWELGGGSYWYSPTNVANVQMVRAGTQFSNGQYFEWDGTNLHWRGLTMLFDNTVGWKNTVNDQLTSSAGLTDLTVDGQCVYVDVVRGSNATVNAVKGTLATMGSPIVPGSRFVIAWRSGANIFTRNSDYAVGTAFAAATTSALGMVKLAVVSATPASPAVFNPDVNGALTVAATAASSASAITGTGDGAGSGGVFTGGSSGSAISATATTTPAIVVNSGAAALLLKRTSTSNVKPTIYAQDAGNNTRFVIDHCGYPLGRNDHFREFWRNFSNSIVNNTTQTPVNNNLQWSATTAAVAGSSISFGGGSPGTAYNGVGVQLTVGAAAQTTFMVTPSIFDVRFTPITLVWEGDFAYGSGTAYWGFGSGNLVTDNDYARFRYNGTTYFAETSNNSVATSNNLALAAASHDRWRIEWYGSLAMLGAATVRFFINEVLVSTITTNIPDGTDLSYSMKFILAVSGSGATSSFGPVEGAWNIWPASPIL